MFGICVASWNIFPVGIFFPVGIYASRTKQLVMSSKSKIKCILKSETLQSRGGKVHKANIGNLGYWKIICIGGLLPGHCPLLPIRGQSRWIYLTVCSPHKDGTKPIMGLTRIWALHIFVQTQNVNQHCGIKMVNDIKWPTIKTYNHIKWPTIKNI